MQPLAILWSFTLFQSFTLFHHCALSLLLSCVLSPLHCFTPSLLCSSPLCCFTLVIFSCAVLHCFALALFHSFSFSTLSPYFTLPLFLTFHPCAHSFSHDTVYKINQHLYSSRTRGVRVLEQCFTAHRVWVPEVWFIQGLGIPTIFKYPHRSFYIHKRVSSPHLNGAVWACIRRHESVWAHESPRAWKGARMMLMCLHHLWVQTNSNKFDAACKVWVFPPTLSIHTTPSKVTEWQITFNIPKILEQKAESTH